MKAVKMICPTSGRFHFGLVGLDENSSLYQTSEIIHSDTLFSAIVNIYAQAFGESTTDELVNAFKAGEISISSAYYCLDRNSIVDKKAPSGEATQQIETQQTIYFLPKPVSLDLFIDDIEAVKQLGKVAFISKMVWEKGILPNDKTGRKQDWLNECRIIAGKFLIHKTELQAEVVKSIKKIYTLEAAPKIADHSRRKQNNIYFQTDLLLQSTPINKQQFIQPHFYFLFETSWQEESENYKRFCFTFEHLLPDTGIGGSISTGSGQILTCQIQDFAMANSSSKHFASMSLIAPQVEDAPHIHFAKTIIRGGRVLGNQEKAVANNKQQRLQKIRMLAEGAILSQPNIGGVPKLHPTGKYYRYGRSLSIPIHSNYVIHE